MSAPELSTRQLRAFLALAQQRNFTRAAQQCHLSQPAFSALIRTLEDAVGARLFDRDTRSVQLTVEGRLFEDAARRLLDDIGEALQDVNDHVARRKGRVHVAALPSLAAGWLPAILAEFGRDWPGITVALSDALSDGCIALVRNKQADFALAAAGSGGAADLQAHALCSDRFHLVCRADHPLAAERRLSIAKIARWPFIQMARTSSLRQALDAAVAPARFKAAFEVEHLATVMGLVDAGLGVSVVPTLTLFHFQRASLVTRPLPLPGLQRTLYVVQRRGESLSSAAQALHDLIMARLATLALG